MELSDFPDDSEIVVVDNKTAEWIVQIKFGIGFGLEPESIIEDKPAYALLGFKTISKDKAFGTEHIFHIPFAGARELRNTLTDFLTLIGEE